MAMALALGGGQIGQQGQLRLWVRFRTLGALRGFHDKMPGAVKVDETARLAARVNEGDRAFKTVAVVLPVSRGGVRFRNAQKVGQFIGEGLKIRPLAAPRLPPT